MEHAAYGIYKRGYLKLWYANLDFGCWYQSNVCTSVRVMYSKPIHVFMRFVGVNWEGGGVGMKQLISVLSCLAIGDIN